MVRNDEHFSAQALRAAFQEISLLRGLNIARQQEALSPRIGDLDHTTERVGLACLDVIRGLRVQDFKLDLVPAPPLTCFTSLMGRQLGDQRVTLGKGAQSTFHRHRLEQ